MKQSFTILFICLSIVCCCQEAKTNEENRNEFLNMALSYSLHSDFTDYNKMNQGVSCTFHEDNTFDIQLWWYGVSSGTHASEISGHYKYDPSTKEISLIFDGETKGISIYENGKPYPTSFYAMNGLAQGRLPWLSNPKNKVVDYSKSCIKIVEQTKDEVIIDLYAFTSDEKKISFGKTTFTKTNLKDDKETINN